MLIFALELMTYDISHDILAAFTFMSQFYGPNPSMCDRETQRKHAAPCFSSIRCAGNRSAVTKILLKFS